MVERSRKVILLKTNNIEIIKNDSVTPKSTVVKKPKFKVGSTVYYFDVIGIVKSNVVNVWKHIGCYTYDLKGYNANCKMENELFPTLEALINHLKDNLIDNTID